MLLKLSGSRSLTKTHILCLAVLVTYFASSFAPMSGNAANLTAVDESKTGNWSAGTMKNDDDGREFCFAESTGAQATVFRIVMYKANKDWFVEALNEQWNFRDGSMDFSFQFNDGYSVNFKGKSYGDALSYDLLDLDTTLAFFGLLSSRKQVTLKNSNGGFLEEFSLDGSHSAMGTLKACVGF